MDFFRLLIFLVLIRGFRNRILYLQQQIFNKSAMLLNSMYVFSNLKILYPVKSRMKRINLFFKDFYLRRQPGILGNFTFVKILKLPCVCIYNGTRFPLVSNFCPILSRIGARYAHSYIIILCSTDIF